MNKWNWVDDILLILVLVFFGILVWWWFALNSVAKIDYHIQPRGPMVFSELWTPGTSTSTPLPPPTNQVPQPFKEPICYKFMFKNMVCQNQ